MLISFNRNALILISSLCGVIPVVTSFSAHAEEPASMINELTTISEEVLLLNAQIKKETLEEKLKSLKHGNAMLTPQSVNPEDLSLSDIKGDSKEKSDPVDSVRIVSIEEYAGTHLAIASYDDESYFQLKKGDKFANDWVISDIDFSGVTFKSKSKTRYITLGNPIINND
jgi:hypothetical protein